MAADRHPATPPPERGGTLLSVQLLRGIAALLVVICHCGYATRFFDRPTVLAADLSGWHWLWVVVGNRLQVGVDIFFCISGFVMMMAISGDRPPRAGTFLMRRLIRIYPAYWIFTAIIVFVAVLAVRSGETDLAVSLDPAYLWTSVLLLPQARAPILTPGWTLEIELIFYLYITLSLAAGLARHALAIAVALLAVAAMQVATGRELAHGYLVSVYQFEFVLGMAIYAWRDRVSTRAPGLQIAAGILGFVVASALLEPLPPGLRDEWPRVALFGPCAALVLSGILGFESTLRAAGPRVAALCTTLGDASYTLYLSHWFLLSAIADIGRRTGWQSAFQPWMWAAIAIGVCMIFAVAFARVVELPLQEALKARLSGRRRTAAALHAAAAEG